jgi:hypothetical protein
MPRSNSTNDQMGREHLAQVRALSEEVASAISAIEQNNLQQLQKSVALQETLCDQIAEKKWQLPSASGKDSGTDAAAMPLIEEIRKAHVALAQVNRVYAAVLKRSQRSAGLIAAIYRNHGQGYAKDAPVLADRHTWSCEV